MATENRILVGLNMKVYQEKWLERLYEGQVISVCSDILRDDTGGTDELTMKLAEIILEYVDELLERGMIRK